MSVIFQSRVMLQVLEQAKRYARSSITVLLCGESGTGKEVLARYLHQNSPRHQFSYLRVNCAALSDGLVESELFGHEAGSFTGAQALRKGHFENAGDGSIFLDEISELPLTSQAKLLRVLEEREFQRVGGNDTLQLKSRVIAATNRDLETEVERGLFRHDLYHRLNVLPLQLPPLRDRREDIPALVNYFIQQSQADLDHRVRGVTRPVMEKLCDYDWPGNIRELRNVILRCCVLSTGDTIQNVEFFSTKPTALIVPEVEGTGLPDGFEHLSLEEIERQVILRRLEIYRGNKNQAAAALGVTPRTLRNKMTEYRKLGYVC